MLLLGNFVGHVGPHFGVCLAGQGDLRAGLGGAWMLAVVDEAICARS